MKKNRKCICCNTQYSYCPNCGGTDKLKPSWYSEFCSEECKDVWDTATKYNMQLIDKREAQFALEKYDLSNKSKYVDCVQRDLANIFAADQKSKAAPAVAKQHKTHEVVSENE